MMVLDPVMMQVAALVAGALVMLVVVVHEVGFGPNRKNRQATLGRMRALQVGTATPGIEALFRSDPSAGAARKLPFLGDVALTLRRAGLTISARAFLAGCGLAAVAIASFATLLSTPLIGVPLGLGLGLFAPVAVLRARHQRRVDAFAMQLPDALDLMTRGLRVGHPVSVTIGNVGRTMPDPIGAEFASVAQQIAHGDYLTDAFADLAARLGQEDVDYLAVSLKIQNGTGGNLADMLGTLSKVIRDRIMMRRRVKAISSEGRISALILSMLPVVIYVATSVTAPDYYGGVSSDPLFTPIACIIVALVVANGVVLRKLSNVQL